MAHVTQSRPDFGLGFQVKILNPFEVIPSSLGSGQSDVNGAGVARGGVQGYLAHKKRF